MTTTTRGTLFEHSMDTTATVDTTAESGGSTNNDGAAGATSATVVAAAPAAVVADGLDGGGAKLQLPPQAQHLAMHQHLAALGAAGGMPGLGGGGGLQQLQLIQFMQQNGMGNINSPAAPQSLDLLQAMQQMQQQTMLASMGLGGLYGQQNPALLAQLQLLSAQQGSVGVAQQQQQQLQQQRAQLEATMANTPAIHLAPGGTAAGGGSTLHLFAPPALSAGGQGGGGGGGSGGGSAGGGPTVQIPLELQGLGLDVSHPLARAGYRLVLISPANEIVDLKTGSTERLTAAPPLAPAAVVSPESKILKKKEKKPSPLPEVFCVGSLGGMLWEPPLSSQSRPHMRAFTCLGQHLHILPSSLFFCVNES